MRIARLRRGLARVWAVVTYGLCWCWLHYDIEVKRKCGPDPAFDYPFHEAACRDFAAARGVFALPALGALALLGVLAILAARAPGGAPSRVWRSPLVAIGVSSAGLGVFMGSVWAHYRIDWVQTCSDPAGPLFHAPYCADIGRIDWEFGLGSTIPLALGLMLLALGGLRLLRSRPA